MRLGLQEYPFVAQLDITWGETIFQSQQKNERFCGAAIRNDSFVVTAAHCFVNASSGELYPNIRVKVSAGTIDRFACNEFYKQVVYVCINLQLPIAVHVTTL